MTNKDSLLYEARINGLYDGWGVCMAWLFAIADYKTDYMEGAPAEWEFTQAMGGSDTDSYEFQALVELEPSESDLNDFADIMWPVSFNAKSSQ